MEISNTTALLSEASDDRGLIEGAEMIRRLHAHGYKVLDFNFGFYQNKDYILKGDDWKQKIDAVANEAAKLGVSFTQSHIPFFALSFEKDPWIQGDEEKIAYFKECTRRAYIASGMLGVKYGTVHPLTDFENVGIREANIRYNHEFYDEFIELGIKNKVGTAYENMFVPFDRKVVARFGCTAEELVELVDSYENQYVGVCWDTGHANEMKLDQYKSILLLEKRLKNLHINDNSGTRDEHLAPGLGTIDWKRFIQALVEIEFDGTLTHETGQMTRKAPRALQDAYITASVAAGNYLLNLFQEMKEQKNEAGN